MMKRGLTIEQFEVFSDFSTDLAAGWFGTIIIFPGLAEFPSDRAIKMLFINSVFGIVALVLAIWLRKRSKEL